MASGTIENDAASATTDEIDATEQPNTGHRLPSRAQVAEYVAELTGELAKMARGSELETIAYLLDIVRLEAETTLKKPVFGSSHL